MKRTTPALIAMPSTAPLALEPVDDDAPYAD